VWALARRTACCLRVLLVTSPPAGRVTGQAGEARERCVLRGRRSRTCCCRIEQAARWILAAGNITHPAAVPACAKERGRSRAGLRRPLRSEAPRSSQAWNSHHFRTHGVVSLRTRATRQRSKCWDSSRCCRRCGSPPPIGRSRSEAAGKHTLRCRHQPVAGTTLPPAARVSRITDRMHPLQTQVSGGGSAAAAPCLVGFPSHGCCASTSAGRFHCLGVGVTVGVRRPAAA